mmetsp:Transcript_100735/g.300480  ORF Transcript_100735/g.300480 Transcript_100735/m.300480 type:complete len:368 (-) Transcript_100735:102-1205(-)
MVLEHVSDYLGRLRPVHRSILRSLALALYVPNARGLHLLLIPPLESECTAGIPVVDGEPLCQVMRAGLRLLPLFLPAMLVVQPLHQLPTPLLDAVIGAVLPQVGEQVLGGDGVRGPQWLRVAVLVAHLAHAPANPAVRHDAGRSDPLLLVFAEHRAEVVLAVRMHPPGDPRLLLLDVVLILEREAPVKQTVHNDAHGPDVDLQTVVLEEELRGPENPGTHLRTEPLIGLHAVGRAKVGEDNVALGVRDVLPVHEVVVTLDVPVNYGLIVQVVHSSTHLRAHVDDVLAANLSPLLLVQLEPLNQVASCVLVHYNADKAPLEEHLVELHNIVVVHTPQHICLLSDGLYWCLHLVDHLHRHLLTCTSICA